MSDQEEVPFEVEAPPTSEEAGEALNRAVDALASLVIAAKTGGQVIEASHEISEATQYLTNKVILPIAVTQEDIQEELTNLLMRIAQAMGNLVTTFIEYARDLADKLLLSNFELAAKEVGDTMLSLSSIVDVSFKKQEIANLPEEERQIEEEKFLASQRAEQEAYQTACEQISKEPSLSASEQAEQTSATSSLVVAAAHPVLTPSQTAETQKITQANLEFATVADELVGLAENAIQEIAEEGKRAELVTAIDRTEEASSQVKLNPSDTTKQVVLTICVKDLVHSVQQSEICHNNTELTEALQQVEVQTDAVVENLAQNGLVVIEKSETGEISIQIPPAPVPAPVPVKPQVQKESPTSDATVASTDVLSGDIHPKSPAPQSPIILTSDATPQHALTAEKPVEKSETQESPLAETTARKTVTPEIEKVNEPVALSQSPLALKTDSEEISAPVKAIISTKQLELADSKPEPVMSDAVEDSEASKEMQVRSSLADENTPAHAGNEKTAIVQSTSKHEDAPPTVAPTTLESTEAKPETQEKEQTNTQTKPPISSSTSTTSATEQPAQPQTSTKVEIKPVSAIFSRIPVSMPQAIDTDFTHAPPTPAVVATRAVVLQEIVRSVTKGDVTLNAAQRVEKTKEVSKDIQVLSRKMNELSTQVKDEKSKKQLVAHSKLLQDRAMQLKIIMSVKAAGCEGDPAEDSQVKAAAALLEQAVSTVQSDMKSLDLHDQLQSTVNQVIAVKKAVNAFKRVQKK